MGTSYTDITFETFKNANLHFDSVYVSGGLLTEGCAPKGSLEDSRTGEKPVGVFIF